MEDFDEEVSDEEKLRELIRRYYNGDLDIDEVLDRIYYTTDLTNLNLSNISDDLRTIPMRRFTDFEELRRIVCDKISFDDTGYMFSIRSLTTKVNNFYKIPFWVLEALSSLSLSGSDMSKDDPYAEKVVEGLKSLDLRSSKIVTINPIFFTNFPSLTDLFLGHNSITELDPDSFNKLSDLEILDLSNNNISKLPENLFSNTSKLKTLDLSNNPFNNIHSSFIDPIASLESLSLKGLNITISYDFISKLKNLTYIDLSNTKLPGVLCRTYDTDIDIDYLRKSLSFIEYLINELSDVGFTKGMANHVLNNEETIFLDEEFIKIDFSGIKIPILTQTWILDVEGLIFNNCGIQTIEGGIFDNASRLKILSLPYNSISYLPNGVFHRMPKLYSLKLYNNKINGLESGCFGYLPMLEFIDLGGNHIAELSGDVFYTLDSLKTINLDDNPLDYISDDLFLNCPNLKKIDVVNTNLPEKISRFKNNTHEFFNQLKIYNYAVNRSISKSFDYEEMVTNLLNIIQDLSPDIQVQVTRLAYLCNSTVELIEPTILNILAQFPEIGDYYTLEQVFVKKSGISNDTIKNISNPIDRLQTCDNCGTCNSVMDRRCGHCNVNQPFCQICKRGFASDETVIFCPNCNNPFHSNHYQEYMKIKAQCPVCKK